jgi:hypothetical protein
MRLRLNRLTLPRQPLLADVIGLCRYFLRSGSYDVIHQPQLYWGYDVLMLELTVS